MPEGSKHVVIQMTQVVVTRFTSRLKYTTWHNLSINYLDQNTSEKLKEGVDVRFLE